MVALTSPPLPPLAEEVAMESPPLTLPTRTVESPAVMKTSALPLKSPAPAMVTSEKPPDPPEPALRRARVRLAALPVSPESEEAEDWAPELALESAEPRAEASPVSPESPERPETAAPRRRVTPLRAELEPRTSALAPPVSPVGPEWPERASGLEIAVEEAGRALVGTVVAE